MKSSLLLIILLSTLVGVSFSIPIDQEAEEDPELTGGFFEGDIELDIDDDIRQRNGEVKERKRWPNGEIYFKFDKAFDEAHVQFILNAMETISNVSCVRFHQANNDTPIYLNILSERRGCNSNIGYLPKVRRMNLQMSRIGRGCFKMGKILHEFLHVLGFYHMQSAPNRNDWVKIVEKNVKNGRLNEFKKFDSSRLTDFGIEYDYDSLMHYSSIAFSKNGKKTIVAVQEGGENMGQRQGMSPKDVAKLNLMYNCPTLDTK